MRRSLNNPGVARSLFQFADAKSRWSKAQSELQLIKRALRQLQDQAGAAALAHKQVFQMLYLHGGFCQIKVACGPCLFCCCNYHH